MFTRGGYRRRSSKSRSRAIRLNAPDRAESHRVGHGSAAGHPYLFSTGAISSKYPCRHGEVTYSKIRPALAKVTLAPTDCLCSADMYPMRTRRSLMNEYLYWLLRSTGFTTWSVLEAEGVAMPKINRETLSTLRLPITPISEQRAQTNYLLFEIARLGRLQSRIGTAIERLDEMRTALVPLAVTGKIDVRPDASITAHLAESRSSRLLGSQRPMRPSVFAPAAPLRLGHAQSMPRPLCLLPAT